MRAFDCVHFQVNRTPTQVSLVPSWLNLGALAPLAWERSGRVAAKGILVGGWQIFAAFPRPGLGRLVGQAGSVESLLKQLPSLPELPSLRRSAGAPPPLSLAHGLSRERQLRFGWVCAHLLHALCQGFAVPRVCVSLLVV